MRRAAALALGLAVLAAAGAAPVPAANKVLGNDAPNWSPDGARIAFTSFRNGKGDIYVMNVDGSGQRQLTTSAAHDDLASWSPDGARIAFVSDRAGQADIYVMNADGSNVTRITTSEGGDYAPTWSPDGKRIAFWTNRDGNTNIYSVNADGSDEQRLTDSPANDHSPKWGPDGRIVWVSTRNTGAKQSLYLMNGDGSDQHRLTTTASFWNESRPAWSPDGSRIAFLADRDFPVGNTEIYTIGADATGLTRLTTYPAKDDFPAWSPDGSRIVFSRGRSTLAAEIYVMDADGSAVHQLTLPKLGEVAWGTAPKRPLAGTSFALLMLVAEASGADLGSAKVSCSARLAGSPLRGAGTFRSSRALATCRWRLPLAARGKLLTGSMDVRSPVNTVTRKFSFRVG